MVVTKNGQKIGFHSCLVNICVGRHASLDFDQKCQGFFIGKKGIDIRQNFPCVRNIRDIYYAKYYGKGGLVS